MQPLPPPSYESACSMGTPIMTAPYSDPKLSQQKYHPVVTTSYRYSPPPLPADVPTAVSTLLGLTKQLTETLRLWGTRQAPESQVSDAYILVGMQFNATVNAFARYHVDMSDLFSIFLELRETLELCLGEGPSQRTLDRYMPALRAILYNLLQGLRSKQAPYREALGGFRNGTPSPIEEHPRSRLHEESRRSR